jgi:hypothetical protein
LIVRCGLFDGKCGWCEISIELIFEQNFDRLAAATFASNASAFKSQIVLKNLFTFFDIKLMPRLESLPLATGLLLLPLLLLLHPNYRNESNQIIREKTALSLLLHKPLVFRRRVIALRRREQRVVVLRHQRLEINGSAVELRRLEAHVEVPRNGVASVHAIFAGQSCGGLITWQR